MRNQLGLVPWQPDPKSVPWPRPRDVRKLRMKEVHQLEPLTEYDPDLLSYRNLRLVIDYICREGDWVVSGRPIREPCDLVHMLREMKRSDKLDHLRLPRPDYDIF